MSFIVDKSWTLFLDRDGVINTRKMGGYIENVAEFEFLPGVLDAMKIFAHNFGLTVVVTNQQGIGKGIMTTTQLDEIHAFMLQEVKKHGGAVDRVYHAPQLAKEHSVFRKPLGGMGQSAKYDFPEIDFNKSIMVGDSDSDIEFGINLGMKTVRVGGDQEALPKADVHVQSLIEFAQQL